ncbi:MAG: hypothetical protein LUO98_06985 [Methanoregula sp.]|nr:hypothetical protein [Methanoregula sp.]
MNRRVFLSCLCLLLLVLLVAVPVIAATVTCPPTCSCLLPAEAKKLGSPGYCSGKQAICGYDAQKNEKYCYTKPVTTTTVPPLILSAKTFATTTPTTVPPQKCASGCSCLSTAAGKGKGLAYCNNRQTLCGHDTDNTPLYCFALPSTPTTVPTIIVIEGWSAVGVTISPTPVPATTGPLEYCTAGCSCLPADKADASGFERCGGSSVACGADPSGRPKYCYVLNLVNPGVPAADGAPAEIPPLPPADGPVPVVERKTTTPVPADNPPPDLIASIGNFFASLFGGNRATAATGPATGNMIACLRGTTLCGSTCTDLLSNDTHCGGCGIRCNFNERCCNGNCTKACTSTGSTGECAAGCPGGSFCYNRGCWGECPNGTVTCNRACVRIGFDSDNCGDCGIQCPANTHCLSGTCHGCGVGSTACGSGEMVRCVDTATDIFNCGACRHTCGQNQICSNGSCVSCPAGTTACTTLGTMSACIDLQTSEDNCGACRNACWFYGDNMNCVSGVCRPLGYAVMEIPR